MIEPETEARPATGDIVPIAPLCSSSEVQELRDLLAVAVDATARQKAARELVAKAIARLCQNRGEKWIQKARLRPFIQRMDPTFDESSLGFKRSTK